jgi:hypothetical protein
MMMVSSMLGRVSLVALSLIVFAGVSAAKDGVSCRSFAKAAADEWADGRIAKTDNSTSAQSDDIVLISAGRKFIVPRNALRRDEVTLQPLGQLANDYQTVNDEELRRCLHARELNIYVNR